MVIASCIFVYKNGRLSVYLSHADESPLFSPERRQGSTKNSLFLSGKLRRKRWHSTRPSPTGQVYAQLGTETSQT